MRDVERDPVRIRHMIEAAQNVLKFMKGKTKADLENDEILFFAVVKNIEIFGEAAFMLSKEFKNKYSHLPWRDIAGMRHVLVHDYYRISPIEVYNVYSQDLPLLLPQLQELSNEKQS